jgi:hypothetical protein
MVMDSYLSVSLPQKTTPLLKVRPLISPSQIPSFSVIHYYLLLLCFHISIRGTENY